MNINNIFTKAFLFKPEYLGVQRVDKIIALAGIASVIIAIAFKLAARYAMLPPAKKYRNKFFKLFLTVGIILMAWYGLAYEQTRIISYRIIPVIVGVFAVVWFVKLAVSMVRHYSGEKTEYEKEQLKLKYLPK